MSKVRAKFSCVSMKQNTWSNTVEFSAVTGCNGENQDFNDATPSGSLSIEIHGDVPAANFFEIGKDYYLDFTPAESC